MFWTAVASPRARRRVDGDAPRRRVARANDERARTRARDGSTDLGAETCAGDAGDERDRARTVVLKFEKIQTSSLGGGARDGGGGAMSENDMAIANSADGDASVVKAETPTWMMDDDDGLTEEQRRVIAERVAALQNRFKKFEEKTTKEKVEELMVSNADLTEREAEMVLRVCNGNEFEANDRLSEAEDGEAFLMSVRFMIQEEDALKRRAQSSKAAHVSSEKFKQRMERLRKRRSSIGGEDDSDGEAPEQFFETEYVLEERLGVQFVRHSKKNVNVKRLRLDDAIAQAEAAEDAIARAEVVEGAEAEVDPYEGWSEARIKAWKNREKNENQYYYRFNAPGEAQSNGKWSDAEHAQFMAIIASLPDGKANYEWGTFSKSIPGRVGYQCSNYYRSLVKNGIIHDENYMIDPVTGDLRFNFKTKGFDRPERVEGEPHMVMVKKVIKVKKPKAPAKPKPKAKPKKKSDDDKAFQCSVKPDTVRRSGRSAKKTYTDGGSDFDDDEFEQLPVLPGFIDPITRLPIEEPTISPYGHVAGYETWCTILRRAEAPDVCPFTKQPLKRRQLVKLTHENIDAYRGLIVENQQM